MNSVIDFARRHKRRLSALAVVLLLYSLIGFLLAPWLLKRTAVNMVQSQLGSELRIEKVAINPFVLSLRVDQLALDDPSGKALLGIDQIFINFQLSSLFRWALTFDEVRIDAPHVYLSRDDEGRMNIAFLAEAGDAEPAPAEEEKDAAIPRLVIFNFAINDSVVDWDDRVPAQPVTTRLGPVNFSITDLSTLPQKEGAQKVVIATETQGTLSWQGSLQLNPLKSVGTASVSGSHLPLLSEYLRQDTGFDIARGDSDIELDYSIEALEDGTFAASINNLHVAISDLLVRTFSAQSGPDDAADRDVLALPKLEVTGGALAWPARTVAVESVTIDDAIVSLYRDADGALNIVPAASDAAATEPEQEAPAANGDADWSVSLDAFQLRGAAIGLIDDSVVPAADIGIEQLNIELQQLSNKQGASFPTKLTTRTRAGGSISASGQLSVLPAPMVDLDLNIEGVALAMLQSYIQSQADISLDGGTLALNGNLHHGPDNALRLTSDVAVTNFLLTETEEDSRLGSWTRLGLDGVRLDLEAASLDIASVTFDEPYADIFIAADGTVNLGRIRKGQNDATDAAVNGAAAANGESGETAPGTEDAAKSAFQISIGEILIDDGSAKFADVSLPLPFEADIAALNGKITTIATASTEPAGASLEGKVDEYGLVRISGTVTPFEPARATDLKVVFQNVEMPKFSAYTIPFAGREIASGKLDLDLGYQLDNGALVGENKIVLREFELGEKVPHPDAVSLPLGLAVALLKDSDGTIDIDLPVRGDVNEPEFSYGRVVGKAMVSLIGKIVTSPFALLGNLVGIEGDELEYITFESGRSDLTPPEMERAAKLAEALTQRPNLLLQIPAVVDAELDGASLKAAQLDALIEARAGDDADVSATSIERRAAILEQLYKEMALTSDPSLDLDELQGKHTASTDADGSAGKPVLDELAYAAELRERLIDLQVLGPDVLTGLATARAENTRAAVIAIDETLGDRVSITAIDNEPDTDDAAVRMRVALSVSD